MQLADYLVDDPRVTLLPIEGLSPGGLTAELAAFLVERCEWPAEQILLFDRAFVLYWNRCLALAERTRSWPAPRLRHVAVVNDPLSLRPYAQMLNTAAWTLYAADIDPQVSHPELAAYLLAHGDRMAVSGEVTMVPVQAAPWWFERTAEECEAFAAAAARSCRPDAEGFRAIAAALPWLRQLRHESLRPTSGSIAPAGVAAGRVIPGTGLSVPSHLEAEPPKLVECWRLVATDAVASFQARWKAPERGAVEALLEWIEADVPPLIVVGRQGTLLWDPETPGRVNPLRHELRGASGAGVRDVHADLEVIVRHTRRFHSALKSPEALPGPLTEPEQRGYAYLHRDRRLIAYNLHEPGIERLSGPALPYARAMLGARTIHEWCHLAVDAGWVPQVVTAARMEEILGQLGDLIDATLRDAPADIRRAVEPDLRGLGSAPGRALAEGLVPRVVDYRANVLAQRFLSIAERETYVRQNIRSLRGEYRSPQILRMLMRYLYEYQYLRFSAVRDRRTFFLRSTWFDDDFFRSRILDEARFDRLASAVEQLCEAYAVDETRFLHLS